MFHAILFFKLQTHSDRHTLPPTQKRPREQWRERERYVQREREREREREKERERERERKKTQKIQESIIKTLWGCSTQRRYTQAQRRLKPYKFGNSSLFSLLQLSNYNFCKSSPHYCFSQPQNYHYV